jgi:hypothetical protein
MPVGFWDSLPTMGGYLVIVALTCVTTALTALFCSAIFRKTSTSLMASYLIILMLFMGPAAIRFFATTFFPSSTAASFAEALGIVSPISATFVLPLPQGTEMGPPPAATDLWVFGGYFGFSVIYIMVLLGVALQPSLARE